MHPSLARETLSLIWRLHPAFVIWTLVDILIGSACDALLAAASASIIESVKADNVPDPYNPLILAWIGVSIIFGGGVRSLLRAESEKFTYYLTEEWIRNYTYNKVAGATHTSRYELGETVFIEKKDSALKNIVNFTYMAKNIVPNALGNLLSCGILAAQQPQWMASSVVWCAIVWFISRAWGKWFATEFKRSNDAFSDATRDIRLMAPRFMTGETSADEMIAKEMEPIPEARKVDAESNMFITCKMMSLQLLYLMVPLFADPVFAATIFSRLIGSVNNLMNFEQQYNRLKTPYEAFRKATSRLVMAAPVEDADETPIEIVVESISIEPRAAVREAEDAKPEPGWLDCVDRASEWVMNKTCAGWAKCGAAWSRVCAWYSRPAQYVAVAQEPDLEMGVTKPALDFPVLEKPSWPGVHWTGEWRIGPGVHIVEGPSGGGKSTIVNALTGQIEGMHIRGKWQPSNLRKRFALFYQALKAKMPFTDITVERLFSFATIKEIQPVAEACLIWELLCDLRFRQKIVRELSGGERTRVALAVKCLQARKDSGLIIVLDEPEQGLDPDPTAYEVMDNIFRMFKGRIIVVVSHLERARMRSPWRTLTHVTGGSMRTVTRIATDIYTTTVRTECGANVTRFCNEEGRAA